MGASLTFIPIEEQNKQLICILY